MERVGRRRLVDDLAADIERQITSGQLQPRDRLPTEGELAATHDRSVTIVRDALAQLRERGYLHTVGGSGTYVSRSDWSSATFAWVTHRRTR